VKDNRIPYEPEDDTHHKDCRICSNLSDYENAYQKFGWEENNTYLPAAASQLNTIQNLHPFDSRELQLQQCPECGTYYLYKYDYEFLVNGSEDEECLIRLTFSQAVKYLDCSKGEEH